MDGPMVELCVLVDLFVEVDHPLLSKHQFAPMS